MRRNDEGLTATYNRFHDKYEDISEIERLRDLHAQMDRMVLDAYGWADILPAHDFVLEYVEPQFEEPSGHHKKKEPWRYRWVDEDRDEVLARLLELNRLRAEEQAQSLPLAPAARPAGRRARKSTKLAPVASPNLFDIQEPT
jgi:hypothetical protein